MDEQAKFAQQTTPDRMKKAILRRARELELPVVQIHRDDRARTHRACSGDYAKPDAADTEHRHALGRSDPSRVQDGTGARHDRTADHGARSG